jgi:glycosyltransferase involved in cell wall biosynthesis
MSANSLVFQDFAIDVVIPAYRVDEHIEDVLVEIPEYIRHIIVVNDASPDDTLQRIEKVMRSDKRIVLVNHEQNMGVGGAMISGFKKAMELGTQIVIKMDGDGQMSPAYLPELLTPLILGQADYTKGNRFRDLPSLQKMPFIRRLGNVGLSFFSKAATGYWNCFDPTNGFIAIRIETLAQLPFEQIDRSYFFETSMLSHLYLLGAYIREIPMPSRYGEEQSSLSIGKVLVEFPPKLVRVLFRRLLIKYFIYDFSIISIYIMTSIPLLLFGLIFGVSKWIKYGQLGIPTPTGTVMLPVLSLMLGVQIMLSAIGIDLQSVPEKPLFDRPLSPSSKNFQ